MPANVMYANQFPVMVNNHDTSSLVREEASIGRVEPQPQNASSLSLTASSLSTTTGFQTFSVIYDSEELWFCARQGCCCGLEVMRTCANDPQPLLVDFQLPSWNDSTSPCNTGTNMVSGTAAMTHVHGFLGLFVTLIVSL